ncbi:phosphoribosylanthranilate isomerase [uncultured Psychroserpens sp.]|uniref:phosphoribosylanthranilate isomerase n=1 Tax=uncultured Psychroserpens sp. TaxID=255436 RepID=UPI00260F1CB1|nr:phosphoribosylanthranilate isomerase [uncultured Psychroserpens sp.]
MKLKVCGMKYKDNINEVAQLQPDYLGFIFYEKSKRYFESQIPQLPKSIKKVGVFVNAEIDHIIAMINKHSLNTIQLHGQETPKLCKYLQENGIGVIKVFSINNNFNFSVLKPYEDVCDYFLFDTKGELPGGNGYTFNWDILNNYPSSKPFFLSGGIGLNEIKKLKDFKKNEASKYCYAIDVNSQFEIKPGYKNTNELEKLRQHGL